MKRNDSDEPTNQIELKQIEPNQIEPKQIEPNQIEPKHIEPNQIGPKHIDIFEKQEQGNGPPNNVHSKAERTYPNQIELKQIDNP